MHSGISDGACPAGDNDVDFQSDQLGREIGIRFRFIAARAKFVDDIFPFYVTKLAQNCPTASICSLASVPRKPTRGIFVGCCASAEGKVISKTVSSNQIGICLIMRLLPFFAAHCLLVTVHCHLITRSALTSTFGGIVRPICLAVFRLITNPNFFGRSTGKSAGLAPLRILSTYSAARRYCSLRSPA